MCWTVFLCWDVGTVISHPTWSTNADCRLTIPGRKVTHLYESAKAPSYVDSDYIRIIRKFEVATGTPYPVGENKTGAYNIYTNIQIISPYTQVSLLCLMISKKYFVLFLYSFHLHSIYHQFIFEILWDVTIQIYLVATNFQHSSQLVLQKTKVHDLNEETSRIDASKRRVASPRVVVHDGMHPTKAEMQEPKDASRRQREIPMCLKVETFKLNSQGVPKTLYRWRFQFLKGFKVYWLSMCESCLETSQKNIFPMGWSWKPSFCKWYSNRIPTRILYMSGKTMLQK